MTESEIYAQINAYKSLLHETDYKAIKHSEGLISDDDYVETRCKRMTWRERINELEAMLPKETEETGG